MAGGRRTRRPRRSPRTASPRQARDCVARTVRREQADPPSEPTMKHRAYPTWFAGGALLLYGVFVLLPSLLGFGFAFTDWNAYAKTIHWVGLDNFSTILDPSNDYLSAIQHTVLFTLATTVLKTAFALALAILLTSGVKRLAYLYRLSLIH